MEILYKGKCPYCGRRRDFYLDNFHPERVLKSSVHGCSVTGRVNCRCDGSYRATLFVTNHGIYAQDNNMRVQKISDNLHGVLIVKATKVLEVIRFTHTFVFCSSCGYHGEMYAETPDGDVLLFDV